MKELKTEMKWSGMIQRNERKRSVNDITHQRSEDDFKAAESKIDTTENRIGDLKDGIFKANKIKGK